MKNITIYKKVLLCFLFIVVSCVGLKTERLNITYYTLEYEVPIFEEEILPVNVWIDDFKIAPVYDTSKIVYSSNKYKISEDFYHRWRVNPVKLIKSMIERDFILSNLFYTVLYTPSSEGVYTVTGHIFKFYEQDCKNGIYAILDMNITLNKIHSGDNTIIKVFQKRYSKKILAHKKNPEAIAKAMSTALRELSSHIIYDTYYAIKNNDNN